MKRLRIARDAQTDVLEIWTYLCENSEAAADRIVDEITSQYDSLMEFPGMGRRRPDIGLDYRSLAVGKYVIYYRELPDGIEISRVLHGSRDVISAFRLDI